MSSAGDVVAGFLRRHNIDRDLELNRLRDQWPVAVGERVAERTWPQGWRDGLLTVVVANSAWLNELTMLRTELVKRINEKWNGPHVMGLRFRVGKLGQRESTRGGARRPTPLDKEHPPLPQAYLD